MTTEPGAGKPRLGLTMWLEESPLLSEYTKAWRSTFPGFRGRHQSLRIISGMSPENASRWQSWAGEDGLPSPLGHAALSCQGSRSPILPPALVPGGDSRDSLLGLLLGQQRNLSPHGPALIQTPARLHRAPEFTVMNAWTRRPPGSVRQEYS